MQNFVTRERRHQRPVRFIGFAAAVSLIGIASSCQDRQGTTATPSQLRTLQATAETPVSETFVFCTRCYKITVTIQVKHSSTEPVNIKFKTERRAAAAERPECRCDQSGWVQFVKEAEWEFDNAMEERWKKIVGESVPDATPSNKTNPDPPPATVPLDIWYGEEPTTPKDEMSDQPGIGNEVVEGGENDGAVRKQFVTRYVCRRRAADGTFQDGTHEFELRWTVYHHADKGWTKVTLSGTRPTSLRSADAPCPD